MRNNLSNLGKKHGLLAFISLEWMSIGYTPLLDRSLARALPSLGVPFLLRVSPLLLSGYTPVALLLLSPLQLRTELKLHPLGRTRPLEYLLHHIRTWGEVVFEDGLTGPLILASTD